jgi:hypothetical protein
MIERNTSTCAYSCMLPRVCGFEVFIGRFRFRNDTLTPPETVSRTPSKTILCDNSFMNRYYCSIPSDLGRFWYDFQKMANATTDNTGEHI